MNHTLSETYTIDTVIQRIQTDLYNGLSDTWNTTDMDAYGRVYKNLRDGDVVPEVYSSTDMDYRDVKYNDRSCFFFIDGNDHPTEDEIVFVAPCKIAFMLKLDDIKTSSERSDADVQRDVVSLVRNVSYEQFKIKGIEKGLEKVFRGFKTDGIKWNDIHPLHVFAVKGEMRYYINDKCD